MKGLSPLKCAGCLSWRCKVGFIYVIPKFSRRHAVFVFKCPVEIGKIVESHRQGDLQDGSSIVFEKLHGFFQAQVVQKFHAGHIHMFFKKAHKMVLAKVAHFSQIGYQNGIHVVQLHIIQDSF